MIALQLQYIGAYKNLTWKPGPVPQERDVISLPGKTKLVGTQVIDAAHILQLIGAKVKEKNGIQSVDMETLRIIYEQIQELSDMGDFVQAQLVKEFVDEELVPGHLPSNINFDEAFTEWKNEKLNMEIINFSNEWGIDFDLLQKSVHLYSITQPEVIPYISELVSTVDFANALNQAAGSMLKHNMILTKSLPEWISGVKLKYQ